jgi:hypothetical protein
MARSASASLSMPPLNLDRSLAWPSVGAKQVPGRLFRVLMASFPLVGVLAWKLISWRRTCLAITDHRVMLVTAY